MVVSNKKSNITKLDYLFIGAHPDDCEIMAGGTLLSLIGNNRRVGIVDLTRGELGSNGSAQIREKETAMVAKIVKLDYRNCLNIKDGSIANTIENQIKVVKEIRKTQPDIVFTFKSQNRHPDHEFTHHLVRSASFLAGLKKYHPSTSHGSFRPSSLVFFGEPYYFQDRPDFVVDVSFYYEKKIKMIQCYKSQVTVEGKNPSNKTLLGSNFFWNALRGKEKWYGSLIGVDYAEGFWTDTPPQLDDPILHFRKKIS